MASSLGRPRAWRFNALAGTLWNDKKVRALSEDARLLFIYLLSAPERVTEGFFRLPPGSTAARLGWGAERLAAAFSELDAADLARHDDEVGAVLIVKGLKYNTPKGSSSIAGALKQLDEAQDAPELFAEFLEQADRYAPEFAGKIRERYAMPAALEAP